MITIFYIFSFIVIIMIVVHIIAIPIIIKKLIKKLNDAENPLHFSTINPFMIKGVSGKKYNEVESEYKFLWILNRISNILFITIIVAVFLGVIFLIILKVCFGLLSA